MLFESEQALGSCSSTLVSSTNSLVGPVLRGLRARWGFRRLAAVALGWVPLRGRAGDSKAAWRASWCCGRGLWGRRAQAHGRGSHRRPAGLRGASPRAAARRLRGRGWRGVEGFGRVGRHGRSVRGRGMVRKGLVGRVQKQKAAWEAQAACRIGEAWQAAA